MRDDTLSEELLAARWRLDPKTLQAWRKAGIGPEFVDENGVAVYPLRAVLACEASAANPSLARQQAGG
jgi:hypothetical protein